MVKAITSEDLKDVLDYVHSLQHSLNKVIEGLNELKEKLDKPNK